MPEQIRFDVSSGVINFHWNGPGSVNIQTQFETRGAAIEAFARLRDEMDLILDALCLNIEPVASAAPAPWATTLASVQQDPRLVARQRPTGGNGGMNYSKLPPLAALSAAQRLAEEQVEAYARAQERTLALSKDVFDSPASAEADTTPIALPQAKRVPMQAEVRQPTHEEALKEAENFVARQKAAMKGQPWPPREDLHREEQILPPPPPVESVEAIADDLSKSS